MSEALSPDQIAALFEAAKSGTVPEGTPDPKRRPQRIRSVDFSRPTKFNAEHQRRLMRMVDTFCMATSNRLSAELRTTVEVEAINNVQVTWTAAQNLPAANSLAVTLLAEPIERRMLMTVEREFMLGAIECLLGGSVARTPKPRRFSEIDWALSHRVMSSLVTNLSAAWHDLGALELEIEDLNMESDLTAIAAVSEPTFVIIFEMRLDTLSTTATLMIPWSSIEPIADVLSGQDLYATNERAEPGFAQVLADVPVTLRAEVASVDLPVDEILRLHPGSVVRLGARADAGVSVYVENTLLCHGQPGAHNAHRAVQLIEGTAL